ncbi:hypothetical protein [Acidihalobacter prosperus]|uniref:Uncharacterized protein n=1 Tax=Acidihalobacter prosperus TaxID=160660 RepID=A0A1A6C6J4_9GAMM|nr:hypothetical protein [Acidihalobacter prosperus]OBS10181.1 hypothetical protein Thpro_021231 [Acidihalobacter prosperus]
MLWYKKQADATAQQSGGDDAIVPAELAVDFDRSIAESKLNALLEQSKDVGGVENLIESLNAKCLLFGAAFPAKRPSGWSLTQETLDAVYAAVFQVRRKLGAIHAAIGAQALGDGVVDLVYGDKSLQDRLLGFVSLVPEEMKKERRAMRDLAAEILHFRDPEGMPLMTRWVWDEATASGALREFIRGNDGLPEIPIDNRAETFEGARVWFAEMLAEAGFYRDVPMLIDLLLAQAYSDYVKAMSSGLGMVQAEFGQSHHPLELLIKLLGVDPATGRGIGKAGEPTLH